MRFCILLIEYFKLLFARCCHHLTYRITSRIPLIICNKCLQNIAELNWICETREFTCEFTLWVYWSLCCNHSCSHVVASMFWSMLLLISSFSHRWVSLSSKTSFMAPFNKAIHSVEVTATPQSNDAWNERWIHRKWLRSTMTSIQSISIAVSNVNEQLLDATVASRNCWYFSWHVYLQVPKQRLLTTTSECADINMRIVTLVVVEQSLVTIIVIQ